MPQQMGDTAKLVGAMMMLNHNTKFKVMYLAINVRYINRADTGCTVVSHAVPHGRGN